MLDVYKFNIYVNARNKCIMIVLFDDRIRKFEVCNLSKLDVRESIAVSIK